MESSLLKDEEGVDLALLKGDHGKFKQLMIHVTLARTTMLIM